MKRAKWKGPFITLKTLTLLKHKKKVISIKSRNSTILPEFIGQKIKVHNGNRFIPIIITENMVGHKFGEFSLTRKPFKYKKK